MFEFLDKIKDILGIEGLRVDFEVPESISSKEPYLAGTLWLHTKQEKEISQIKISLIEKYRRGRNADLKVTDYVLSELVLDVHQKVTQETPAKLQFELPISLLKSEMDSFAEKNILARPLVSAAKKLKKVHSEYRIEAVVSVKGTTINTISSTPIQIKKKG